MDRTAKDYSYARRYEDSRIAWGSVVAGALLTALGGYLVFRATREAQPSRRRSEDQGIEVTRSVTVNRPASELYRYWRDLEHLPEVMSHLESVSDIGSGRSHWVAKGPVGMNVEWDAEIVEERENELLSWRSLPDADVQNEGSVRFREVPGDRGTEITVSLTYHPPAGALGAAVARLFGKEPYGQIGDDLHRFKQRLETGEVATTDGQPSGRASGSER